MFLQVKLYLQSGTVLRTLCMITHLTPILQMLRLSLRHFSSLRSHSAGGPGLGSAPSSLALESMYLVQGSLPICAGRHPTAPMGCSWQGLLCFFSTPAGLLMKLHIAIINTGTMSLILVAFRSQEPVWSCAPRFMLPYPLPLMGKFCINYEWWRGVTALSCPPSVLPADTDLDCHPL